MPKDKNKYCYPYPRLERASYVYERLAEDATRSGMTIADVMVIRCADFYAGVSAHVTPEKTTPIITAPIDDVEANARAAAEAWEDE